MTIELKVPDIGDFKDVEIIEILVKPGDTVAADQSLITIESDKASMEIPSSGAGVITELKVKIGDKINQGTVIAIADVGAAPATTSAPQPAAPESQVANAPKAKPDSATAPAPATAKPVGPAPAQWSGKADVECQMMVLGSGPGGYAAAFRAADLGMRVVLVERYTALGGVCLNVGCIPSKALLHVAQVMDEAAHFAGLGITYAAPQLDLDKLRAHKDEIVGRLSGGVGGMAKGRKVDVQTGVGSFLDPHHIAVVAADGSKKVVKFEQAIIAAGSQPVRLPFLPEDPRIVDSTGALQLRSLPKRMLIIGGGIIGLEMGTVYSTFGARLDVVEMLDGLMQGADRDMVKVWQKFNEKRFDHVMMKTKTVKAEARDDGIYVTFEGEQAPKEPQRYDLVLQSVGRVPNGKKIGAGNAGIAVTDRGFIDVDKQMRTNVAHIFAIGDIVGQPMLAHKATHEGHVAAEAASGQKSFFDARVIPSVAYTDPEIAWVGVTEDDAKKEGRNVGVARFPWLASGRAIANTRDEGFTKLIFDHDTHRIVGGAIVGTHAGDLISEVVLAIEMGADATDIGKTIHPHPTLGETVGMAAELYEGVLTDLPPPRKQ
ncbi:MAG: dihydrolipoyl dehydrogenase [Burkholderiaceae bacterium]